MGQKIKLLLDNKDILLVLLIVFVGAASFGLGRLSAQNYSKNPVRITYPAPEESALISKNASPPAAASAAAAGAPGEVVASKEGSKYHLPWCPGAMQISEKNKIRFASAAEAEKAGYTKAANCKGL